jgi:hypothetical protein
MKYRISQKTGANPSIDTTRTETLSDGTERTSNPPALNTEKVVRVVRDALKENGEIA